MEINHPSHDHLLVLKKEVGCKNHCSICRKIVDGNHFYKCWTCEYYIHKSCAVLPLEINHHFHKPHPLKVCSDFFECDSCHKTFEDDLCFRCFECHFHLDVKCALMSDIEPSRICSKDGDIPFNCIACMDQSSNLLYGYIPCSVHDSCSDIPTLILHVLHPQHVLCLQIHNHLCEICNCNSRAFKFCCEHCSFAVHALCVSESASKKEAQNLGSLCFFGCKRHLQSQSCVDSKYIIDQSFIQLPREIKHQFHSHEPLQLLDNEDFWCDSCHKPFYKERPSYGCGECDFQMDVRCTLMPSIQYDEGCECTQFFLPHHLKHQHPLQLIKEACEIGCIACERIHSSPIYGCIQCEYFLHQACIELPTQIKHPLHDRHELSLQTFAENCCSICLRSYTGLSFKCSSRICRITIGIECAFGLRPSVLYKYHDHLLCLVEAVQDCYERAAKGTFCRISKSSVLESMHTKSYCLQCMDCRYNIDLLCGPLPCTIKHKGHVHEMTLVDSVVEDDSGEYYCDICEEERDPRLCAYYCKECEFICHVHCVICEVAKALKGELGEVRMRVVNEWTIEDENGHKNHSWGFEFDNTAMNHGWTIKALPYFSFLRDILDSLTPEDVYDVEKCFHFLKLCPDLTQLSRKERLKPWSFSDGNVIFDIGRNRGPPTGVDSDLIRNISFYDDDVMENLNNKMSLFNVKTDYLIQFHEFKQKIVVVGDCHDQEGIHDSGFYRDHWITSNYSQLLLALFKKYGDLSIHSSLREKAKTVIFYLLCRVLADIIRTPICDITEDQLFEWNFYLEGVQRAGFHTVFRETLHRIKTVYVGVQATKFEKTLHDRLQKEIAEAHERIAKLTTMLDESTKSSDGYGLLLKNSKVVAECIREAKLLQWKTGKYFLPDKQVVSGESSSLHEL